MESDQYPMKVRVASMQTYMLKWSPGNFSVGNANRMSKALLNNQLGLTICVKFNVTLKYYEEVSNMPNLHPRSPVHQYHFY